MSGIQGQGKSYNLGKGGKVDYVTFKSRGKVDIKNASERIRRYFRE